MTAKKNAKKTPSGTVKNAVKNAAATVSQIKDDTDTALDTVKESVLPTRALLHPRELDFSVPIPHVVKTALLALLFFLIFQFAWTGAGKIRSFYRQYRQFREWRQNILPPNPFDDDGGREGIRNFIKRHFPRGASRAETEEAARIFADAADRVESGELINEDDLFGYLAENLRPVCLSAGWPDFVDGVWSRIEAQSESALPGALREVSEALGENRRPLLFKEAEPAGNPEEIPAEQSGGAEHEPVQATAEEPAEAVKPEENRRDCPSGTCPVNRGNSSYGGYYWWW